MPQHGPSGRSPRAPIEPPSHQAAALGDLDGARKNAQLAAIVAHSFDAIISLEEDGTRVRTWNRGATEMFGWLESEAVGQTVDALLVPPHLASERAALHAAARNGSGPAIHQTFRRHKSGRLVPVEVNASRMLSPEGVLAGFSVIFRDLSERQKSEARARESEERFATAFRMAPAAMFMTTLDDGRIVDVNDAMLALTGHAREEVIGRTAIELGVFEDAGVLPAPVQGGPRNLEREIRTRAGGVRFVLLSASVIAVAGRPQILATAVDVTERKQAERRLARREAELSRAQRIGRIGSFEVDLRHGIYRNRRSPEYLRIHGLPADHGEESHEAWVARIHPEDRQCSEAAFKTAVATGATEYTAEYRIIRPNDGETRWISVLAEIDRDEAGRPLRLFGAHIDVTEQKSAEEALRRHAERQQILVDLTYALVAGEEDEAALGRLVFEKVAGVLDGDVCLNYRLDDGALALVLGEGIGEQHRALAESLELQQAFCGTVAATCQPLAAGQREIASDPRGAFVRDVGLTAYACHPLKSRDGRVLGTFSVGSRRRAGYDAGEIAFLQTVTNFLAQAWERMAGERALRESEERFRTIFATAHEGIWALDRSGRTLFANPRMAELLATTPEAMKGRPVTDFCFAEDIDSAQRRVVSTLDGEAAEFEVRFRRTDGKPLHVLAATAPWRGRDGSIIGGLGGFLDLAERKRAEDRQRLLMRELAHRGKNLLAVIQSIAGRSLTGARSTDEARESFIGRLRALARTYGTLTDEAFEGAPLGEIVTAELASHGARARIDGPAVMLTAKIAQTFALVVHELATNAAKHGALSVPQGRLDVSWSLGGPATAPRLLFEWREEAGPAVSAPSATSFGTTIVTRIAGVELQCTPELSYAPEGFRYRFDAPLAALGSLIEPGPLREKLRSTILREFYDQWDAGRNGRREPPSLATLDRGGYSPGLTLARIDGDHSLEFLTLGRPIEERIRPGTINGAELTAEDHDALREICHRCARGQTPCHEHFRFEFGDEFPVTFERLLVPYRGPEDGHLYVAGLVVFSGPGEP